MDHYLDIRICPDPEFSSGQLMSALFAKLHRALVTLAEENIAVSFPEVDESRPWLGPRLRLHGSEQSLRKLFAQPWLAGMRDHLRLGDVLPVPDGAQYRTVSRVQAKSSPERLRRRHMRRHDLSEDEARKRIPDSVAESLNLPYLQLRSQSTGQAFRLFIRHGPLKPHAITGNFSRYGLSSEATVPWF